MGKYKILVVGCGSIGQRHARLLAERAEIDLFIADPLEANLRACAAAARPKETFTRFEHALQRNPQGVFVCTPNHLHVDMTLQALDAGAAVLVEKPVAETAHDARRLMSHPGRDRAAVGYVYRFDKLMQMTKQLIADNTLGNIVYANASVYSYFTLLCAKTPFREEQEWVLAIDYSHEIDFLRFLVGEIEQVAAFAATGGKLDHLAKPNCLTVALKFQSGALGTLHIDYVRHPEKRFLEVVGDKGAIDLQMTRGLLKISKHEEEGFRQIARPYVRDDLFRDQIDDFLQVLEGKKKPLNTLADGVAALEVAEAIAESAKKKQFMTV